jgi:hypothetical protein
MGLVGAAINAAACATTCFSYFGRVSSAPRDVRHKFGASIDGIACTNYAAGDTGANDRFPVGYSANSRATCVFTAAAGFHRTAG